VAPDEVYVGPICCCILYQNELIWERIKDALEAPPELDPIDFEEDPYIVDTRDDQRLKEELLSNLASPHDVSPPPNLDPEPQPTPDYGSVSNSSASTGEPLIISVLSIEPVLMTTSPVAEHDRLPTRLGDHRMRDISEDVREESSENENEEPEEPASSSPRRETIQGLCISTGPAPPGLFATGPNQAPTSMRAFSMSSVPQRQQSPQVPGEVPSPPMRSGSMGSMQMQRRWAMRRRTRAARHTTSSANAVQATCSSRSTLLGSYWDPHSPPSAYLFFFVSGSSAMGGRADDITSFSNPALHSRGHPPAPAFSNAHDIRMGVMRVRCGKPSWADGWDPTKHEYAVTASEGSVGGH